MGSIPSRWYLWLLMGLSILVIVAAASFRITDSEAFVAPVRADHSEQTRVPPNMPVVLHTQEAFLTPAVCDRIRAIAQTKGFVKSRVVAGGKAAGATDLSVRDSEQVWIKPEQHPDVMEIYRKVESLTGVPMTRFEDMQVVRYENGTQYKEHYDDCRDDEDCADFWKLGGRRVYTVIVYLNGPEEIHAGGETAFPRLKQSVVPQKGKLVWFRNLRTDGTLEEDSLHAARPVTHGIKYACQIWIRQKDRPERLRTT